jgi:hypothetical protein
MTVFIRQKMLSYISYKLDIYHQKKTHSSLLVVTHDADHLQRHYLIITLKVFNRSRFPLFMYLLDHNTYCLYDECISLIADSHREKKGNQLINPHITLLMLCCRLKYYFVHFFKIYREENLINQLAFIPRRHALHEVCSFLSFYENRRSTEIVSKSICA